MILVQKLQVGVSTAAFFPRPLTETLDILAHLPWRSVEFMPQTPGECRPEFADTLLEQGAGRFQFCGIHFPLILAPFLYNPYPGALEYGQQLCRDLGGLAGRLSASSIVVHGPWDNMAAGSFLEATLHNIRVLCEACEADNVVIALENTPGSPMGRTPEDLIAFAKLIDRPNISFTVDITHAYQLEQDPMIYLKELPEIAHVHASDFDRETNQRHTAPGSGVVDWKQIVGALKERSFAGNFILELLPDTLGDNAVQTLQQSIALLDPFFEAWSGNT